MCLGLAVERAGPAGEGGGVAADGLRAEPADVSMVSIASVVSRVE